MIGASKLNKEDARKIRALVAQGLNDCEISRQFISHTGESITREHVRAIRIGQRWNQDNRSFVMKEDLSDLPILITEFNGHKIETQLGWMKTKSIERWFFLTLLNDEEVDGPLGYLMERKPSKREILNFHNKFISLYL